MLKSPIRLEQSLLVDSCEFLWLESGSGVLVKSQNLRCHSGSMCINQSFEHDQIHMCDPESDLNAWTCALRLTPLCSHCPLKKSTARKTRFRPIFIEQSFSRRKLTTKFRVSRFIRGKVSIFIVHEQKHTFHRRRLTKQFRATRTTHTHTHTTTHNNTTTITTTTTTTDCTCACHWSAW